MTINVFLASSEELKHERKVVAALVNKLNYLWDGYDIFIHLVKWEYLDSSISVQHKQEDYNDQLRKCDVCIVLFWTKFGPYTKNELDIATQLFVGENAMTQLGVYFKEGGKMTSELQSFRKDYQTTHSALCKPFDDDSSLEELIFQKILLCVQDRIAKEHGDLEIITSLRRSLSEKDPSNYGAHTDSPQDLLTKKIRIVLSADKSLELEQLELADLVENLNHSLSARGAKILMLVWENGDNRQQNYADKVDEMDMCLNIYYDTFTDLTQVELDTAYQKFCDGGNPRKIYVYFKDAEDIPEELRQFRDGFPDNYGHFYCSFSNIDTLRADFLLQFIEYHNKALPNNNLIEVNDGKVSIDGNVYVNLENVPFAGNNEEYNLLLKSIKRIRKLITVTDQGDDDYMQYTKELSELLKKQKQMEKSLWETAMLITRLSTQQCSERLERAMSLFQAGDNKGAKALLDEDVIDNEVENNKRAIQHGREAQKALMINIDEYSLKIKSIKAEMAPGWYEQATALYQKTIDAADGYVEDSKFALLLYEFASFLHDQRQYHLVEPLYERGLAIYRMLASTNSDAYLAGEAIGLTNLAVLHYDMYRYSEAEKEYTQSLNIYNKLSESTPGIYLEDVALIWYDLAALHDVQKRYSEAEKEYTQSLVVRRKLAESNLNSYVANVAWSLRGLAHLHSKTHRVPEAEDEYLEALRICRKLADSDQSYIADVASTLRALAGFYCYTERYAESEAKYSDSLVIYRKLEESNPNAYLADVATCLNDMAVLHRNMKNHSKAEVELLDALSIRRKLSESIPDVYNADVAKTRYWLANIHHDTNRNSEAEEEYSKSLAIYRELAASRPDAYLAEIARNLEQLALIHYRNKRYSEAENEYNDAIINYKNLVENSSKIYLLDMVLNLVDIANLHKELQKYKDAEKEYVEAIRIYKKLAEENSELYLPQVPLYLECLASVHMSLHKYKQAEEEFVELIGFYRKLADGKSEEYLPNVALNVEYLAALYENQNMYEEAEEKYADAIKIYKELAEKEPDIYLPDLARNIGNLAILHDYCHKYELAEKEFYDAITIYRNLTEKDSASFLPDLARNARNMAYLYYSHNKFAKASVYYKEALTIYAELAKKDRNYYDKVEICQNKLSYINTELKKRQTAPALDEETEEVPAISQCSDSEGSPKPKDNLIDKVKTIFGHIWD